MDTSKPASAANSAPPQTPPKPQTPITGFGIANYPEPLWRKYFRPGWVTTLKVERLNMSGQVSPWLGLIGALLIPLAGFVGVSMSNMGASLATKLATLTAPKPDESQSPPLSVSMLATVEQITDLAQFAKITSEPDAAALLQSLVPKNGATIIEAPNFCDMQADIFKPWNSYAGGRPGCRLSKDKDRLWIWSYIKTGNEYYPSVQPTMAVIRYGDWEKVGDPSWRLLSVEYPGARTIQSLPTIATYRVRQSLAHDIPDVVQNLGKARTN